MKLNGARIRLLREELGLRQVDLAAAAGLSKSYLCGIEAGMKEPSPPVAQRIAGALGVSIANLR